VAEQEDLEQLSKDQLLVRLRELQSSSRPRRSLPEAERLLHELQVHQVELEMQNRELRETQERLLESGARYSDLYDFAPVAYCTLDGDERIVEANIATASLFQLERSALIGRKLFLLVPPESRSALREGLQRCFQEEAGDALDLTVSHRVGEPVVAHLTTTPVLDRGVVVACRVILTDITTLKRSERMLNVLARASALLASSPSEGSAIAEVIDLLVPEFADMCLIDVAQPDSSVQRIRSGDDERRGTGGPRATPLPAGPRTLYEKIATSGKALLIGAENRSDRSLLKPDADLARARSALCVPLAGQGGTLGVLTLAMVGSGRRYLAKDLAFAQDVTGRIAAALESARLFRETRQAVEAREHVLGIVSHDLRTPLSGILLAARGLEDTPAASDALAARLLDTIQRGVERMSRMIDDLLDVSSIDAGRLSLDLRDQEAGDLVEDALKGLKPMTREKNLHLHADAPDRGILVRCDRDRILQVFANLIGNSIKFAPRGGSISLDAVVNPSSMKFAVRDTGPGVDPALLSHLFERYSQATATSRRGRGLGLYICKGIIEAHGGRIWAQSEPSKGLTVFFTLPRAAGAQPTRGKAGRGEGTVMIVDDDDVHRRALADMLQAAGYAVGEARDGLDALEQVRSARPLPRLILLDLQMPRMDGWELMRQLRKDSALASIPVVLVSGYSRLGAEAEAIGAKGYVRKPVRPEQLLEAIGRCGAPEATG